MFKNLRADLKFSLSIKRAEADFFQYLKILLNPRFFPILIFRTAFFANRSFITKPVALFLNLFNKILFGIDIPLALKIGPGVYFPHPQNIVLGAEKIGSKCVIYHGVTLGAKFLDFEYCKNTRPIIEDSVIIGCNSTIIGPEVIESGARIKPHSLIRSGK